MSKFYSKIIGLLLPLLFLACEAQTVTYVPPDGEIPECLKPICEVKMSTVITETAANANFSTGLTLPSAGESSSIWWDIYEDDFQQLADRTQRLSGLVNTGSSYEATIPLHGALAFSFDAWEFGTLGNGTGTIGGLLWGQADLGGALYIPLAPPPGRTITAFRSRVRGNLGHLTTTIHSGLPATMPTTSLVRSKYDGSAIEVVDTVTDSSASVAVYDDDHDMTKTLSSPHTVSSDYSYYIRIVGEASTNAQTYALGLYQVKVTYGLL